MTGIALTGFTEVHWFSYVLAAGFLIASLSGFCLGVFLTGKIAPFLGVKD